jgi:hypothetical protein
MNITKRYLALIVISGALAQSPAAFAADPEESRPQVSIGMKVWNSSWSTFLPGVYTGITPAGAPALADSIDAVEGDRKTSVFPVLGVRKGNTLLSASYAKYATDLRTLHSSVVAPNGMNVITSRSDHLSRKESDLTAGYFVTPNIALTAGFKYATEIRDTTLGLTGVSTPFLDNTVKGLLFGALANFSVQGNLRFYSQLGYGFAKVRTEFADPTLAPLDSNGRYLISEIGLNYALAVTDVFIKGANAGLGYRSQIVKTHGSGPAYRDRRDFRDTKDGIVFSLNVAI